MSHAVPALKIAGEMTIYQAVTLKQSVLESLEPGQAIQVDLSGVTAIDGAGIQLLLLWQSLSRARGLDLRLVACSPEVVETLALLRLSASFGLGDANAEIEATAPGKRARP
jgi:anti-anti-sigma factor